MSTSEKLSRMVCNECSTHFDIKDAAVTYRNYGGVNIMEKRCPQCGGTFRSIELPKEFDQYLYVNDDDRYYTYTNNSKN